MTAIANYAAKYSRDLTNNFAAACYDQNSLDELRECLASDADATDIETWGLVSEQEYRDAIGAALADLAANEQ